MKDIRLHSLWFSFLLAVSPAAFAEATLTDADMQDIKQYCEEVHPADSYEDQAMRQQSLNACIEEERSRYTQETMN